MKKYSSISLLCCCTVLMLAPVGFAQQNTPTNPPAPPANVPADGPTKPILSARPSVLSADATEYTLGAGDEIMVNFIGRPELTGTHIVGPDGRISMPLVGDISVKDQTRVEAAKSLEEALAQYYPSLSATISVTKYGSNKVMVLGNVEHPGYVYFDGAPTLLEAVTKAGMTNPDTKQTAIPERLAIYRGADKVFWVQLREMLESGDRSADVRLTKNDIVFVPQQNEALISVMGAVERPGAVRLRPGMTLLSALAEGGGPSEKGGNSPNVHLVHNDGRPEDIVPFKLIATNTYSKEIQLRPGDTLYIPKSGFYKTTYFMERIAPMITGVGFAAVAAR